MRNSGGTGAERGANIEKSQFHAVFKPDLAPFSLGLTPLSLHWLKKTPHTALLTRKIRPSAGAFSLTYKPPKEFTKPNPKLEPLEKAQIEWFASRGISAKTLERNQVQFERNVWIAGAPSPAIAFPYFRNGELVNIKYRSIEKRFTQIKGAEKVLYGLDDVAGATDVIFVEGEIDKLSLEEAGFLNVVSVPDGAPRDVKEGALPDPEEDTKFSYLWASRGLLDLAARVIIATDNDGPGNALAEELARRLGRERCWRVKWPGDDAPGGKRKDANDVLVKDGPGALQQAIEKAEAYPIRGLFR